MAAASSDEFHYNDPCSLLDPKEVEAVLGAQLGVPPYRSSRGTYGPAANGSECVYETADFHAISLSVDFKDGAQGYKIMTFARKLTAGGAPTAQIKKAFTLDDGSELTGEWDEAQLTAMNCCIFNALRGDQLITIDFTSSGATLRQAAGLVDAAYKRIDKPLKIDGAEAVNAAKALAKTRPRPVDPCSLLSRTEVEAIIGPLAGDAVSHGTDECTYPVAPLNGAPRAYDLNVKWDGGYAQWRSTAHIGNLAGTAMRIGDGKPDTEPQNADEPPGTGDEWSHAGIVYNDFVIVKKDVLLKLDMRLLDHAAARNLLVAVARKI